MTCGAVILLGTGVPSSRTLGVGLEKARRSSSNPSACPAAAAEELAEPADVDGRGFGGLLASLEAPFSVISLAAISSPARRLSFRSIRAFASILLSS